MPGKIALRLGQPVRAYSPGADISLIVSVANLGDQTLLVCRILGPAGQLCFWDLQALDRSGRPMRSLAAVGDRVPGPPASFANTLISNWIALTPGYDYSTTIEVHDVLGTSPPPGVYKIRVALSSDGPGAQSAYNGLSHYQKETASLPYRGWKGRIESNWVSVRIVSHK